LIQTNKTNSSYFVWITDEKLYASVSGINSVNPEWSYLFVKINSAYSLDNYVFITQGQRGSGITTEIDDFINRTIDRFEKTQGSYCPCDENAILNIGYALNTQRNWSSICGRPGVTNALVHAVDGLWINKQRGSC
jgi:hypothetical protein